MNAPHVASDLFVPLSGGSIIGLLLALIKAWAELQSLKTTVASLEADCKKVAAHETEIALLKATVTRLDLIPEKLDRLYDLMRSKS